MSENRQKKSPQYKQCPQWENVAFLGIGMGIGIEFDDKNVYCERVWEYDYT